MEDPHASAAAATSAAMGDAADEATSQARQHMHMHMHMHAHARPGGWPAAHSLLMQPAWQRVLAALGLVSLLWLAVAWALGASS